MQISINRYIWLDYVVHVVLLAYKKLANIITDQQTPQVAASGSSYKSGSSSTLRTI